MRRKTLLPPAPEISTRGSQMEVFSFVSCLPHCGMQGTGVGKGTGGRPHVGTLWESQLFLLWPFLFLTVYKQVKHSHLFHLWRWHKPVQCG